MHNDSCAPRCDIDLHIGLEKTGTTAIQAFLADNRHTLLAEHGILFPRSLGGRLSANLAAACQCSERPDDLRKIRGLLTREAVDAYRETLADAFAGELAREQPDRLIISCEHFSSRLHQDAELEGLRDFLAPRARSIRVWVWLRRQDRFQVSAYSTAVRAGRSDAFRWPEEGRERPDLHFDRLLDRWASVFGDSAIRVRLYERGQLHGGDIVSDFCRALALPPELPKPEDEANRALNARLLEFLREFNRRVPRFDGDRINPLRGDIGLALAGVELPGEPLDAMPGAAAFQQRFAAGNRRVAQRWFAGRNDLPATLFEAPLEPALVDAATPALSRDELVDLCAHLWRHAQEQLGREQAMTATLMSELAIGTGNFERAETLLSDVLANHPGLARAWAALAQLAQLRGDSAAADEYARRALELAPNDPELRETVQRISAS